MRRHRLVLFAALLGLAACATPEERCIAAANAELRTIDGLILETRSNIARGYAIAREPGVRTRLWPCRPDDGPYTFCLYDEATVVERPVAIDREAERRKLASLMERREELQAAQPARIAACRGAAG